MEASTNLIKIFSGYMMFENSLKSSVECALILAERMIDTFIRLENITEVNIVQTVDSGIENTKRLVKYSGTEMYAHWNEVKNELLAIKRLKI